jgi:hypothetical protein
LVKVISEIVKYKRKLVHYKGKRVDVYLGSKEEEGAYIF